MADYIKKINNQTELDLVDVKSEGTLNLRNTAVTVDRDKNVSFTERALQLISWGRIDLHDPDQVRSRINKFFQDCQDRAIKPSVSALALALSTSRDTLYRFVRGEASISRNYPVECVDLIRGAYQILDVLWEDYMQNGQINPACGIFLGKNHFGYRDVQEYSISPGIQPASISAADLESRYEELPDEQEDEPNVQEMLQN